MSDDLQARIDRIAAIVLAKGSALTHPSDTEVQIRRILEAWGPRTTYRYLRDHGLLESFVSGLPMPSYAANDPQTILETFQGSWDDFSADALTKLEAWQMESSAAALLPRLAAYAGQLFGSGHAVAARRVLRVAKTVADQERLETHDVEVQDLKVGDLVRSVGTDTIGFGPDHLAGRVQSIKTRQAKTAEVEVVVHVPQRDATYHFCALVGTHVEIGRLVRPDHAQSLRLAALDRLMRAEEALEGVPGAQSRVARLRHELSATIASEHVAEPKAFKFKVYVGPTGLKDLAKKFEDAGQPVHLIGTEHLYFQVEGESAADAEKNLLDAAARAGLQHVVTHREIRNITGPAWDVTPVKT